MSQPQPFAGDLPDWKPGLRSQVKIGGRFLLLDETGHGSAGVVYKARDTWSDALVALKVLKGSAAMNPRLAAGFRRECEIGRQISHPNVVSFVSAGVHEGWTYLAMEYVGGRPLAELLSLAPRMPMEEFEPFCRQLLAALECVHGAGIVHLDVKPANLMLGTDGQWKLMDFGISRPQELASTVGPPMGTPQYMSPEQMLGNSATAQADLFSAGVVLFEALTGRLPFANSSVKERCTTMPPRASSLRPGIPAWLDETIARCLVVNPKERFASAEEMALQLGSFKERPAAPGEGAAGPPPVPAAPALAKEAPRPAELPVLRDYLTDSPGKAEDVLGIFLELLRLLQHRGETHDPLTPDSVHRSPSGRVEIRGHQRGGTRDTMLVANPKYAAPEVLHGQTQPAGPARVCANVYSVGFMMYEFLLGRELFRRQFPGMEDSGSGLKWMEWHSDAALRTRPAGEILPGTPHAISAMVAKMTEKDASQRCATYEEAIRTMQVLVNRTKVTQELLPASDAKVKARTWWERPLVLAVVTALALGALLAVVLLILRR